MLSMVFLSTILILGLWLPGRSEAAIICFTVFFGFSSGAGVGLGPVLISSISPMNELGMRMGTIIALAAIGTLTGPPIAGAIIADDGGSYRFAAVFAGVNFFLSFMGIGWLRVRLESWQLLSNV